MAALRKLAAAATTSALLAPRARAAEAPAADEEQAAELRAKTLALAAAQLFVHRVTVADGARGWVPPPPPMLLSSPLRPCLLIPDHFPS